MDYSNMSDFEINRMVGDAVFKGLWSCRPGTAGNNSDSWYYGNADASFNPLSPLPDYCNDAADAWPIILNSRISMVWDCAEDASAEWWNAFDQFDECRIQYQSNPLRGAMIVFLMMQDSANVQDNPA